MSFISKVRSSFHKIIEPIIVLLVKLRITPNMVTTSALLFLGITVYFIVQKQLLIAGLLLILTSVVDSVDGAVAAKVGSTKFGDFYDAFIDRIVEAVIFVALAYAYPKYYLLCFVALVFSFMTSYIAARAEVWTIGIKIKYLGIGGRAGRLITLILALLFNQLSLGLSILILLAGLTMVSRTITTFNVLRKK